MIDLLFELSGPVSRAYVEGLEMGRQGVVSCLVTRPDGRIFAQRRSSTRKTFPGCWDLVGGHVEPGERPFEALVRELDEETGWSLDTVLGFRKLVDWQTPGPEPRLKREFLFAVTIRGAWDSPRLEVDKVTEGRWFGLSDLEILNEHREGTDRYVHECVRAELLGAWDLFPR